ncbi:MAG: transcriptional repressor [Flavobacteriales bacterium]|jgi:Fur family ferric uptake transcriptional regulator|nr:transcriptional repressor [Flavobacteriales bacterium]
MVKNLLKSKKIRETAFRLKVLEILLVEKKPLTVEEIEKQLGKFDRITLYRTIKTFEDKGVIHEIVIAGEPKRIALCASSCKDGEHHHHLEHIHFFCETCKETYCIDHVEIPEINIPNYVINSFDFQMKGMCEKCLNK